MTRKFADINQEFTKTITKVYRRRFLASPMSEFLGTMVMMVLMYVGGTIVLNQTSALDPEAFIAYLIVFSQIITPAKAFSTGYYNIQKGMASANRIAQITDAEITITETKNPKTIDEFKAGIEYKSVDFKYDTEYVLKDINLSIERGHNVALVGPNGSGKTTLANLIPRFYDPDSGRILIDGEDIRNATLHSLRSQISMVTQNVVT